MQVTEGTPHGRRLSEEPHAFPYAVPEHMPEAAHVLRAAILILTEMLWTSMERNIVRIRSGAVTSFDKMLAIYSDLLQGTLMSCAVTKFVISHSCS